MKRKNKPIWATVKRAQSGTVKEKSAQSSIPFTEWFENKLFRLNENTYSLICSFDNSGYLSKTDSEKDRKYRAYTAMLCELPSYIHYEEIVYNRPIDKDAYIKAISSKENGFNDKYEKAFFDVQKKFVQDTDYDRSIQRYLLAISVTVTGEESPYNKLQEAFVMIYNKFKDMDSNVTVLSPEEVFKELYRAYNPFSDDLPSIPSDIYRKGLTVKDFIAPGGIKYENDSILLGEYYARVLSVTNYGSVATDYLINALSNNGLQMYISKHIDHVNKNDAVNQIRKQYNDLIAKKTEREEKKVHIPGELARSIEGCQDLLEALANGEEFLRQTLYITVFAKTKEKLLSDCERIKSMALSQGVLLKTVTVITDSAFKSILPLGKDYLMRHQFLLASEAGIMTPFSYEKYFDKNGFYYGNNFYTAEPIIKNRKKDTSSHGFVFGNTGSGKGMWTKHEISNVMYQPFCAKDQIVIIDPSGEYVPLAQAAGGKIIELSADGETRLNPLSISDKKKELLGENAAKADKILSLIALLAEFKGGDGLTGAEKSIIDRAALETLDEESPTLITLYEKIAAIEDPTAQDIISWLERYVKGSITLFSGKDNAEEDQEYKITVITLKKVSSDIRDAVMLTMLERIEDTLIENKSNNVWTWVYIDEMHRYFHTGRNPLAAERFARLYAEARKYGGILTGITQLPRSVLASSDGESMLSLSRFVVFSELDEVNIKAVAEAYSLNEEQQRILRSPDVGQYVLRTHNAPIAVKLLYPGAEPNERNEMFDLFNTSFGG